MKRILLDTNIYELILKGIEKETIYSLIEKNELVIYGNDTIRKELRDLPKEKFALVGDKIRKLRIALLSLYDLLVRKTYPVDNNTKNLAEKYFIAYKSVGGHEAREKIINDFLIVASATLKNLDIVVSEDRKTMLSSKTLKVYDVVNNLEHRRTPNFIGFGEFEKEVRRYGSL